MQTYNIWIGDELIRVSLEAHGMYLQFVHFQLQVYAPFELRQAGRVLTRLSPDTHQGDIQPIWDLVGRTLMEISTPAYSEELTGPFRLTFSGGASLEILPCGSVRGVILGELAGSEGMVWDEI